MRMGVQIPGGVLVRKEGSFPGEDQIDTRRVKRVRAAFQERLRKAGRRHERCLRWRRWPKRRVVQTARPAGEALMEREAGEQLRRSRRCVSKEFGRSEEDGPAVLSVVGADGSPEM